MYNAKALLPALATLTLLAACGDRTETPTAPSRPSAAASAESDVRDRYIVVFDKRTQDVPGLTNRLVSAHGGTLLYRYEHALKGFAARLSPAAAEALRHNPNVAYVEPDAIVYPADVQSGAPWGLDRIDQYDLPLNDSYAYSSYGAGVTAYVIDTGIDTAHPEFGGRASVGYDALGGNGLDCHGHGTHVAGILGSATYGVAKSVSLVSVRVFDCNGRATASGTTTSITAGIDWVTAHHATPAVANLSLTQRDSANTYHALDDAVRGLIASGVTAVVGAAQTFGTVPTAGEDACWYSPARVPEAITVGATNSSDSRVINAVYQDSVLWTSNYGPCVDLFAPGDQITSTWPGGGTALDSGTSMATPFVAGFAARYLGTNPTATPANVTSYILSWNNAKVTNAGTGSPTTLLYTGGTIRRRACC